MYYIGLFSLLILIIVLIVFLKKVRPTANQSTLEQSKDQNSGKRSMNNNYIVNRRKNFRVPIIADCLVEFLNFENKKLDQLKNKTFNGQLENLSVSGIKLSSNYNLPIKQKIIVKLKFTVKEETFNLKGQMVRKEEHEGDENVIYGIHFIEVSQQEEKLLSNIVHNIEFDLNKAEDSNHLLSS